MTFEMGRANLEIFSDTLRELARRDPNLLVVTSDSRGSAKLIPFAEEFPERIVETGIAEQNLVGISAGLASCGKTVFAVSPSSFLTARALEQIKNDVAYSDNPVNVIGISGGVSYGALGSTHHSIHDIAALKAIHNIDVIVPADNFETRQAVKAAARTPHPVFIRFGKRPMPHVHRIGQDFKIGQAITVLKGRDVAFITTGETTPHAMMAANELESEGISASVVSMHTVKPLDVATLISTVQRAQVVITVEEHSVYGGLGEACAAALMQHCLFRPLKVVGIPDEYTVTGSQEEIFNHYGISARGLAQVARELLATGESESPPQNNIQIA
jgi:transketolase